MAKSFDHLRDGMSADSRARSEERTKEMVEETDCTHGHSEHEPCVDCLQAHIDGLEERVLEYSTLFELQHKRILQATEHWQKHTGKKQTWPDLGDLLEFLCDRIDEQGEAILNANELVANLTMALDDGAVEQIEVLHEHVTGLQCAIEDHKNKLRMIEGLCKEGS